MARKDNPDYDIRLPEWNQSDPWFHFSEAMRMFSPFPNGSPGAPEAKPSSKGEGSDELNTLKQQMADMQAKLDKLASK